MDKGGNEIIMNSTLYKNIMLVCDMDMTLLNSSSKISNENLSAIHDFTDKGGYFTIATGRMHDAVRPYISDLPINIPAILYNGAMIYDFKNNNIVWQQCLEENVKPILKWIIKSFPDVGVQVYSNNKIYICRNNEQTEKHIIRENLEPIYCDINNVPFPWIKAMLVADNNILTKVKEGLKLKETSFRSVFSEPQFLEILYFKTSKGNALNELMKILGFSRNNVISMGDNLNDIELIDVAGIGIAVGNAHPELKKIANYCCCDNNSNAVAEVISWINDGKLKI